MSGPHDGTHVRVVAVFERVEQRGGLAGRLDALAEFVVHALRLSGSAQKRRGTAVEGQLAETQSDPARPASDCVVDGAAAEGPRIGAPVTCARTGLNYQDRSRR